MFLLSLLNIFKINFFKILFQEHYRSVRRFGSRSGPTFLDPNCLQRLSAKVISRPKKLLLTRKVKMELNMKALFRVIILIRNAEVYHQIYRWKSRYMAPLKHRCKTKYPVVYPTITSPNENFEYNYPLIAIQTHICTL